MSWHAQINLNGRLARRTAGGAVLATLAVGLSACGSTSASPPSPTTAKAKAAAARVTTTLPPGSSSTLPGTAAATARNAFRDCLAQHGLTLPARNPGASTPPAGAGAGAGGPGGFFGGGTGSSSAFAKAAQACAKYRPAGGFGGFGAGPGGAGVSALAKDKTYTNCLKVYGVTLPARPAAAGAPGATTTIASATTTIAGAAKSGSSRPVTRPTFSAAERQAFAKCAPLLPAGARGPFGSRTSTTTTVAG